MSARKWLASIIVLWTALVGVDATAQLNGTENGISSLARAWGYYQGQMLRLDLVERRHPDLQGAVFLARSEFKSAFPGFENNFARSFAKWGAKEDDIAKMQQQSVEALLPMIDREPSDREAAQDFIQSVRRRAKGVDVPEEVLQYLLATAFMDKPEQELIRGWRRDYSSIRHPKAKGVTVVLKTPRSFTQKESTRPNIVSNWQSESGNGLELLTLMVLVNQDKPLSRKGIEDDLRMGDRSLIRRSLIESGRILAVRAFSQEQAPGYIADIESDSERAGNEFSLRQRQFVLFLPGRTVAFLCQVTGARNTSLELDAKMTRLGELCRLVANSLVLPQQYPGGK